MDKQKKSVWEKGATMIKAEDMGIYPDITQSHIVEELRVIAYRPQVANFLGSIEAAIYHQQLSYWQGKAKSEDGFFYKSANEIYDETFITEKQQRRCRAQLVKMGWIEVEKRMANGHPTYHFKVNLRTFTMLAPIGKRPVPIGKKASSITVDYNSIYKHSENTDDEATKKLIEDIYTGYLLNFKIDRQDFNNSDKERKLMLMEDAKKKYKLTDKRRDKVRARLKDAGYEMVRSAIINCGKNDFYRGDNDRKWYATLDWICNSYEKVEEWATK